MDRGSFFAGNSPIGSDKASSSPDISPLFTLTDPNRIETKNLVLAFFEMWPLFFETWPLGRLALSGVKSNRTPGIRKGENS